MSINRRIFGTPIDKEVRKKLEFRQGSNPVTEAGDPLYSETFTGMTNYDYSARLPFVRMWTSIKILEAADIEILEELSAEDVKAGAFPESETLKRLRSKFKKKYGTEYPKIKIDEIKGKDGKPEKYVVKGVAKDRGQRDYVRKIYEIGNHNYLKNYGEAKPNEAVNASEEIQVLTALLPNESENNPFMKPQSGITAVSSETEGALGLIKKTTVSFTVYNFYDFDNIFSKYFLFPGAQIFVDFGFADIPNLYRPQELITYAEQNKDGVQGFLSNEEKTGQIDKNLGDLEILQGIVTDYSATVQQDGSVNCSVTLTSKNSALLSFATDDDIVMKIKSILTRGIIYLGLQAIIREGDPEDKDKDLFQLQSTPNADMGATADDIETYNKNLTLLAQQELSGRTGPEGNAIRTGVFVENLNADNSYIAWGLFEDLIINSQFGFGKDEKDINEGKNLQVRMNTRNSFTKWTSKNREKQHVLMQVPDNVPSFLFPEWWYNDDPDEAGGSYSHQKGKSPVVYDDFFGDDFEPLDLTTEEDKGLKRIPIREVFINVDMIIKAFESNDNVKKVVEEILTEINDGSDGLFDWKMKQGETEADIEIIDANFTITSENKNLEVSENPFFTFEIQSPNSMVKDYGLDFKLPSGNIGNMYAIQGLGAGDSLFSTNPEVQKVIAIGALDKDLLKIIYEPDMGNHRAQQLLDEPKVNTSTYNVFKTIDSLFDDNVYKVSTVERPKLIEGEKTSLSDKKAVTKKEENQPTLSGDEIIQSSDEAMEAAGFKVAKNFTEYYTYKISSGVQNEIPNLLPYNLNLTILGIASLNVGDTFKVDYLPKRYLENTYLQITKISHEIGPAGWYTSLDTAFRLLPNLTDAVVNTLDKDKIRLSPTALSNIGFEDQIEADAGFWSYGNDIKIADFAPYMTDIQIKYDENWAYDYELRFRISRNLEGEIANESGYIKNRRGNFNASFTNDTQADNSLLEISQAFSDAYGEGLTVYDESHSYVYTYLPDIKFFKIWPPDVVLVPGEYYRMMVYGDKIALVQETGKWFDDILKYFRKYTGSIPEE